MTRRRSPFADALPAVLIAVGYALATLGWLAVPGLPGGRWFAVHLFTLGVLTNVILAFSDHFGRTVTRTPGVAPRWSPVVTNLGILVLLIGLPARILPLVAFGATTVTVAVIMSYRRLRAMRRAALGARFAWIVRAYERAHGAFVHAAILGLLLGIGALPGPWYGAGRLAHLHANILGWGGITLLATLVFFGPTMARTRIEPGADDRAARALRHGATGLTAATVALLATGFGGTIGTTSRWLAAAGLAVFAAGTVAVCLPVARAAWHARPTAPRSHVIAVSVWLPVLVLADVVVVATGAWRFLDALGVVALVGVLAQAVLGALLYLAPMLRGADANGREQVRARLEIGARSRLTLMQAAVVMLVVTTVVPGASVVLTAAGWVLIGGVVLAALAAVLLPPSRVAAPA
jgi:hypothetical protein